MPCQRAPASAWAIGTTLASANTRSTHFVADRRLPVIYLSMCESVERFVAERVGVHEHAAVSFEHEETCGEGQVRVEAARVVDGAAGNDETHRASLLRAYSAGASISQVREPNEPIYGRQSYAVSVGKRAPGPVYQLTIPGAVEAVVSVGYVAASFEGARPTPVIRVQFINVQGASAIVSSTVRQAAETLQILTLNHRLMTPELKEVGRSKSPSSRPTSEPSRDQPAIEFEGFRQLRPSIAERDRHGRISPTGYGSVGSGWADGEFPLTWIQVSEPQKRSGRVSANFLMDVWAAANLRDRLHGALTSVVPNNGPNAKEITIVDGVVGTFPV